jgi:hypothetical protein
LNIFNTPTLRLANGLVDGFTEILNKLLEFIGALDKYRRESIFYLRSLLINDELGHGVRNLLEQDRSETRVESSEDTLLLQDSAETAQQTVSESGLRDL